MKKSSLFVAVVFVLSLAISALSQADEANRGSNPIPYIMNQNIIVTYGYDTPDDMSKTFIHADSSTIITKEYDRETWIYEDGSKIEYLTVDTPNGTMEIGRREYNTSGILIQDLTYFPSTLGVDISGPKMTGMIWGNGCIVKKSDGRMYGPEAKVFLILGVENVTVPAGIFENCTKICQVTLNYNSIAWYAEGVGMVKRIGVDGLMELQSYVP
ncbi:hypothetical protein KAR91_55280 [Candidatus Pacearchaeota archaeon]|nr:hypothetical protein [Candidatus Pacearchaeota archaeon]